MSKSRRQRKKGSKRKGRQPANPSRSRAILAAAGVLVVLIAVWAWRGGGPQHDGRDVLLISIDTLRADHLGCYGDADAVTPNIDELAREGVTFEQATTPVPQTLPSHATMLTALIPPRHGARINEGHHLPGDVRTLARHVKELGYQTGGFIAGVPLQARSGLNAGFDHYDDFLPKVGTSTTVDRRERYAENVLGATQRWMQDTDPEKPVFAFVHLFDPHEPYEKPLPGSSERSYAGEIAHVDRALGDFFDSLRGSARWDDMLIVLTSDHGESLGEHGESTHGFFIYESTQHVPLIVHCPELAPAGRVTTPVGVVDVPPTILDLAGLPPMSDVDGRSLVPLMNDGVEEDRPIYVECLQSSLACGWAPLRGIRHGDLKYISAPRPELYDLASDPKELKNVYWERRNDALRLAAHLKEIGEGRQATAAMDEATARQLAALGYVGASSRAPKPGAGLADPKDRIEAFEGLQQAHRSFQRGELDAAWTKMQSLESVFRESPEYHAQRGRFAMESGRDAEAVASFDRCVALDEGYVDAHVRLGVLHGKRREVADAREHLGAALALDPNNGEAHLTMSMVIASTGGSVADVNEHLRRFVEAAPDHPRAEEARKRLGL